ncbi:MAG: translocation/assembly module TamB domain-containing protein [Proteobacteria bacterium]|nr:translocation/assembly module TamB domain-containing protein [Pseudomonadota bacterium]
MTAEADLPPPAPSAPPSRARRLVIWALGGLLALGLCLLLAILAINTGPGRAFIARQVSGMTFANGLRIGIGRIDGSLYGKARLIDLRAYDGDGEFLRAPAIDLDWRPFAYLRSHVDVRSAAADSVLLERAPRLKPSIASGPLLPDLAIDVGRLHIARLIADPAVTGARRELSVDGQARIAGRRAQVTARVNTLAAPGGTGGGDRLDLTLDAVPEANRLALNLKLDAPKNGVIAALAGLDQALTAKIDGSGDWERWNGTAAADLGGEQLARLGLTARSGTFAINGTATPGLLYPGVPAALLGPVTRIALTAALDQRRAAVSGSVRSDVLSVIPAGVIDLARSSFDGLKLNVEVLRPAALGAGIDGRALRGQFALDGAFAQPQVDYALSAAALTMNGVTAEGLTAKGQARVRPGQILVPIDARAARITGLDSAAGGPLAQVRLSGDLAFNGPRIMSDNLRIHSDRIDAKAIVLADMSRRLYTGALAGRVNAYRIDSVGTFAIETDARLKQAGGGFALTGTVKARSTQLFNTSVKDFLGGNAAGSAQVAYGADGVVRFSRLRLSAPLLRIADGHGSYGAGGQLAISASGHSTRYGPLAVELTGTAANPRAVLVANSPGFGMGLTGLRAQVIGNAGDYRFAATGQTDYGPLSAEVSMVSGKGPLTLQITRGDLAGIGISGTIRQSPAGPFVGQLDANGRGLTGIVKLDAEGRHQLALINVRARDTVLPGPASLAIGSAIIDARVVLYDQPWVVADVQLAQTRLRSLTLVAARAKVDYRDGRGQAQFLTEGISAAPFRIAGNAQLEPGLWRVALDGRVRGVPFRTSSPARIVPSRSGYELLPTRIDFGQGSMRLAGTYGAGLKLQSRIDKLDMALLNAFYPGYGIGGQLTGSLDFEQSSPSAFPRADATLSINGFTRTTAVSVSKPVDVNFVGHLLDTGGEGRAVIRQRGAVIGRMNASLGPLGGGGGGDWAARLGSAPLGGGIRFNGPAETLWSFAGLVDQSLSGSIAVGVDFSGRLDHPQLSGIVRGQNMAYDNQTYGTRLTNMMLTGKFVGDRLQIDQMTATAGQGKIAAQGYISLAAAGGYPMDVTADLDNARLARSDALSSSATGRLRLTKTAGQTAVLSGTLRLPETRYQLVRQGSAEIPELGGVRFKASGAPQRVTGNEPAPPQGSLLQGLRLDIALTAPRQFFVTGMGLDSEWSADLHVTGTNTDPRLNGTVDLVRGNLGFAGRQFQLQEGRLLFTGGPIADTTIALSATEDIDDVAVTVTASGGVFNPKIEFTSSPALPSDEIVSRIMFGNSVGQLSPLQGLQLAASLNALRSTGGGLNPLGKLRAATGISRLRILAPDETTGRGTAIASGSYITNNVYLELITDARGFTATQIEISLSRTLSILSQAGGSGVTNFNLRYRKRY